MQLRESIQMLENDHIRVTGKTIWVDLGCGNGAFTLALATFLDNGSIIYAMDKDRQAIEDIPLHFKNCSIKKIIGDFAIGILPFTNVDGILMANSFHYIKDKPALIEKMSNCLKEDGRFLIVEYDTDIANRWVPYPVRFSSLHKLFSAAGFSFVEKIHERKSIYNEVQMYSAVITK